MIPERACSIGAKGERASAFWNRDLGCGGGGEPAGAASQEETYGREEEAAEGGTA